jgi:hypothetical protein
MRSTVGLNENPTSNEPPGTGTPVPTEVAAPVTVFTL